MLAGVMPPPDSSVTTSAIYIIWTIWKINWQCVRTGDEKIDNDVTVRIYHPKEARTSGQKLPVCVYAHGGGYCCGNLDAEDPLCRAIARFTPCIVVSVDYRLGPRYKMPTMIDDCVTAYKWVSWISKQVQQGLECWCLDQAWQAAEKLGADQHKYFSAGGSAGGGLAFSIAEKMIANGKRDCIQGIVALVPVTLHYSNIPDEFKSMYTSYVENEVGSPIIDKQTMTTFFGKRSPPFR